jgi:hypothetical protein
MFTVKMRRSLSACALLAAAAGCGTDSTAPAIRRFDVVAPSLLKLNSPALVEVMQRTTALPNDVVFSKTIRNSAGGTISDATTGFTMEVPPFALGLNLGDSVTFTVRALAGTAVAYDFEPHGRVFVLPLKITQDTKGTTWYKSTSSSAVEGGYFTDRTKIKGLTATVDELLPVSIELLKKSASFYVTHFSGYLVSSGRR